MKKFLTAFIALVLVIGAGVAGYVLTKSEAPSTAFGAVAGPDVYQHYFFHNSLSVGGEFATSSLQTSSVLQGRAFTTDSYRIDFTPNVSGITLTTVASSTLSSIVPKPGDSREYLLCNATTTAATPFTFAAGTGMKLQNATSTAAIAPAKCAQMTLTRKPNTDIDVLFDLYI